MNSLERLHLHFANALKETHGYIGPSSADPAKLEKTNEKTIRLNEVFKLAIEEIERDADNIKRTDPKKQLEQGSLLLIDADRLYQRYQANSRSFSRVFLKTLARFTPEFLKSYLPACFSNKMEEAEKDTEEEFAKFGKYFEKLSAIPKRLSKLDTSKDRSKDSTTNSDDSALDEEFVNQMLDQDLDDAKSGQKDDKDTKKDDKAKKNDPAKKSGSSNLSTSDFLDIGDEVLDDDTLEDDGKGKTPAKPAAAPVSTPKAAADVTPVVTPVDPPKPTLSKDEIEKQKKESFKTCLNGLTQHLNKLNQFPKRPLSLDHFKMILADMSSLVNFILELDHDNGKNSLESMGLKDAEIDALMKDKLQDALEANDTVKIEELLQATVWKAPFAEALAQTGSVTFGIRKTAGQQFPIFTGDKGPMKESEFQKYRGAVKIILTDVKSLGELEEFKTYIEKNEECCPSILLISLTAGQTLTPELIKVLTTFTTLIAEIRIEGIEQIDFKQLNLPADEELEFVRRLENEFFFPQLKNITLSDHPKTNWTETDFSKMLSLSPSVEMLKACCKLASKPENVKIPATLLELTDLNLAGFPGSQVTHLLSQLVKITTLNLSGSGITDDQLNRLIATKSLTNVKTLDLSNCKNLTTDCLAALISLNLAQVTLPDLPKGKQDLTALPRLEDAFKVRMFYTTSKVTQPMAAQLYRGPITWASVFQIPLARQGIAEIYSPTMRLLDHKSVGFWLHNDEYKNLTPQNSIATLLCDSNAALNDDNIVEFFQKFPKVGTVSLVNCPNVSEVGLLKLLEAFKGIRRLDLTGCQQFKNENLFNGRLMELLSKLDMLILTWTQVTQEMVEVLKEEFKIEFEEATLTITDDQLTDEDSIEKILDKIIQDEKALIEKMRKNKDIPREKIPKIKGLSRIKQINLQGCTKLTNSMLGKLLDHLNAPIFVIEKDKTTQDNPERLNLAVLDLSLCPNITEEAFDLKKEGDKYETKHLGNLGKVIIGETKIKPVIAQVIPQVIFKEIDSPDTTVVDPNIQLAMCQAYHANKVKAEQGDEEAKDSVRKNGPSYLYNRMAVEIFGASCQDQALVKEVLSQPVKIAEDEFSNFEFTFKKDDDADPVTYRVHRDVLACQSLYFLNCFRPGGMLSKISGLTITNVHATPEATKVMIDLFYGKANIVKLTWQVAHDAAELCSINCYHLLAPYYNALIDHIHSRFDLSRAKDMLIAAEALKDKRLLDIYDTTVLSYLESLGTITGKNFGEFQKFVNLSKAASLPKLQERVEQIQNARTKQLEDELIAEQNRRNEQLTLQALKSGKIRV